MAGITSVIFDTGPDLNEGVAYEEAMKMVPLPRAIIIEASEPYVLHLKRPGKQDLVFDPDLTMHAANLWTWYTGNIGKLWRESFTATEEEEATEKRTKAEALEIKRLQVVLPGFAEEDIRALPSLTQNALVNQIVHLFNGTEDDAAPDEDAA